MSKSEDRSPYGPGFVAACIVVGAIVICGVALIATTGSSSGRSGTAAAQQDAAGAGQLGRATQPAGVATPVPGPSTAGSDRASACGLSDGEQGVPSTAPGVDRWEVSRKVVVPQSAKFGPARTDPDGFRRCFAHSPTGAVYAAYNALAALADVSQAVPTVKKLMLPGANTDALIAALRQDGDPGDSQATQIAGYRILDAGRDRATIMLALPVEGQYMSATLTLVWQGGDWRVVPPQPGNPVGAPFSQLRGLGEFVAWSGV
ncbi:hypothetical protein [Kribbella sp.]|uniref:hypothetical protein n=1 Tax=Kribbella sp. TaxID=1871183 RepID=UPI002D6F252D|nr:hypothetical protein [Kribbella sp.]HZX04820.1 hypothetical protein [Kribbella sp.]